ncbi:2-dehydropantoate 2-reductase [Pusillimonas sp. ANT_WB101]|nr:2-dehydropantoate 2-reductase [Pusillimonas sp. ANT_WB101]
MVAGGPLIFCRIQSRANQICHKKRSYRLRHIVRISRMKVCVFGAGAVGGYLLGRIGNAGVATLSVVARGAQKEAIEMNGLRLETPTETIIVRPDFITDRPTDLPEQDVTFVALKAMGQPAAADALCHLTGQNGYAVFAANGIPWWWKVGSHRPESLPLLDPDAALWNRLTPERALGCVVYSANEVIAPGVVRHLGNNRWVLGEPNGQLSSRLKNVVQLLLESGVNAEASTRLHEEIWIKLLRNASVNSLCALTRLPIDGLADDPELLAQAEAIVDDIVAVAQGQGYDISEHRIAAFEQLRRGGAEASTPPVRGLRPSMLQDVSANRPLEVEAVLGQVQALAREAEVSCPAIDVVLPVLRGLNRSLL